MRTISRFLGAISWLGNIALAAYSLVAYSASYMLFSHWIAGFLMLSVPVLLFAHLLFLGYWLFNQRSKMWLSGIFLLIGTPFWQRTVSFNLSQDCASTFSLMTYNLMWFDVGDEDRHNTTEQIRWIATDIEADVKCFQEFFESEHEKKYKFFTVFKKQYPYQATLKNKRTGSIGLVTVSKYPIVHHRSKAFNYHNGLLETDIVRGKDTIRVINIQLQSMGVRVNHVIKNRKNYAIAKHETKNILIRLREGFIERRSQVDLLTTWIKASPYPVIVCGDFNETPYGYAYGKVNQYLQDAFVKAGNGFGFSYNKRPQFIRIDKQFCDESLKVCTFEVIKQPASDHYPIRVSYQLPITNAD